MDNAILRESNSLDFYTRSGIAKDNLTVKSGDFVKTVNGFIDLAGPYDIIEGDSIDNASFSGTNETNERSTTLYYPYRVYKTWDINVTGGSLVQGDVFQFFRITFPGQQTIDYTTKAVNNGQFRLEKILTTTRGEFRLVRFEGPFGPQGASGMTGLTGSTGSTGPAGPQGPSGPQGLIGPAGGQGSTGSTGITGASGVNGSIGATGATGPKLIWENVWNSGTSYQIDDLVQYNGSTYIAVANNLNKVPGIDPEWNLVALKGATGPSGLPGTPGGATGLTGATGVGVAGPSGATGMNGATGQAGATGLTGPQGSAGPFSNEYVEYFKDSDQTYSVPAVGSNIVGTIFQQFLGNPSMAVGLATGYMKALSVGVYEVSQEIKVQTDNVSGPFGVTAIRSLFIVTDNLGTPIFTKIGILDDKFEIQEYFNNQRTYTLSATALIDLNVGDRIYCVNIGSSDTVFAGDVIIRGPSSYIFGPLAYYAGSKMFMKLIYK